MFTLLRNKNTATLETNPSDSKQPREPLQVLGAGTEELQSSYMKVRPPTVGHTGIEMTGMRQQRSARLIIQKLFNGTV
jgi:hypothetical protein